MRHFPTLHRVVLIQSGAAITRAAVTGHARHPRAPVRNALGGTVLLGTFAAAMPAFAAPAGGTVTSGSGSIGQSGTTTTITQTSSRLAIDWSAFGIQAGETVNFIQPGAGAIALNRVTGHEATSIFGSLNANGTVFILNPNGVLFGGGAQVNVGGLVASTLGLSNADFEAGRYALSGGSTAGVTNQGTITVPSGGKVALIANSVDNAGNISAPRGSVLLAGAGNVTLTLADGSPLGYTISAGAARTLVNNGGMIVADGGRVVLTARGLDSLSESVVNTTGVVRARTVGNNQGTIELIGDPVAGLTQVSGQIDASAPDGGGNGGSVKVLGTKVGVFDGARIDVSGMAGGGTALIGGNAQGAGPEPNATATYVAPTAAIDASAIRQGNGGRLIVWGTDVANVHGSLSANGGAQGGNGGHVETSGHALDTDGIAVSVAGGGGGTGGLWLLDPYNVTLSAGTQTGGAFSGNVWTPSASGSLVNTSSIQSLLNSGGNVTITTTGAGTQEGNIAINGSISKTAGGNASLTLIADGRITTNASSGTHRTITSTSGTLDVSMTARATTSAASTSGINLRYVDINANGGNISATASGAQSGTAAALSLQNSSWSTIGAGNISLSGTLPDNGNSQGVFLNANTLTTASGSITVSGTSGGIATITGTNSNGAPLFSTSNIGVYLAGGNTLRSTGGGAIALTGTATGATATWAGSGVTLSALDSLSTSGAVTISGTASNPVSSTYRNQLSTVNIAGTGSNAASLTGGTVTITGTNSVVGNASSTSNGNAAVKLDGKVNLTATAGPINIAGSNAGGDGVWGSGSGAVTMSAPASSSITISARSLDSVSGYSGFYIGGGSATLTFATAAPVSIAAESLVGARKAFWNKGGLTVPGNLSIVTTGGAIADDTTHGGYFHVTGSTSIDSSGAGNTVSLTNSGNTFAGAISLNAGDTTLASSTSLTLDSSTVNGALNLTAPGITQSGAVSAAGATTLNGGNAAITLTNDGNAFNALAVTGAAGVNVVNANALSVTGVTSTGAVRFTTLSGDLATRGNWSISGGDLTLSAGAGNTRGTASGGNVDSQATLAVDAGRTITVYSGAVGSTVLGGSLAGRAAAGSGNFRYNRQDGDAPGADGIGDGATSVMYRERPTVTVTPTDAANTKVYDGGGASDPALAYTIVGQVNGDSATQILSGSLARAAGQNAGRYAISQGTLADQLGYQTVLDVGHAFSIMPAPLLITANGASRTAGQDNPAFSATFAGFVGGQTAQTADLRGTLRLLTSADAGSPAGSYAIVPDGISSNNYSIRYAAGTLSVLPASPAPMVAVPGEPSYMNAVIDMQARIRAAGLASAPEPAERSATGWRTTTATFRQDDTASDNVPGNRLAAQE